MMLDSSETWLLEHAVAGDAVLSWVHPTHRGYAYPEAAGLLLRWFGPHPRLASVAARLQREVLSHGVGRSVGPQAHRYTFDTGVALAGLQSFGASTPAVLDPRWAEVAAWLHAECIVQPPLAARWSTTPGPHLLKLAVGASAADPPGPGAASVLRTLERWPLRQHPSGRLETLPHAQTYLHAHAYAAEGLLASAAHHAPHQPIAEQAVAFLAEAQRSDGGLPAWHDGRHPCGPARADTTAQAVRLFQLVDRSGLALQISRGLAFLDRLSNAQGVVRYDESSEDLNTWASLFTLQARAWARSGPTCARELL